MVLLGQQTGLSERSPLLQIGSQNNCHTTCRWNSFGQIHQWIVLFLPMKRHQHC